MKPLAQKINTAWLLEVIFIQIRYKIGKNIVFKLQLSFFNFH